jgi:hypothetical protein
METNTTFKNNTMKTPVSFRIPSDLYDQIKKVQEKERRSTVTDAIIALLYEAVELKSKKK